MSHPAWLKLVWLAHMLHCQGLLVWVKKPTTA